MQINNFIIIIFIIKVSTFDFPIVYGLLEMSYILRNNILN